MASIRSFVALDLPPAAIEAVAEWQEEAFRGRSELRAIRPAALHVTLAFLGNLDEPALARAEEAVAKGCRHPRVVPARLLPEPVGIPERRPRLVALEVDSDAAVDLRGTIASGLAAAGLFEPGDRPFWPHLSVARVRGDPRRGRSRRAVLAGLPPLSGGEGHTFDAVRVALYRSELRSQGARYSVLAAFDLPRSGG